MIELRPYQKEILSKMNNLKKGSYIVNIATGLGKTVCFAEYINQHPELKFLILVHREELIHQPIKYISAKCGIEKAKLSSEGESVIVASVQTLFRRLEKYPKNYFDVIITDECHHSPAETYQEIYNYFDYDLHFGFTATVNRFDKVRLDKTFDKIIFEKSLVEGIKEGYLSNIYCERFYLKYDLSKVKSYKGDYKVLDLIEEVNTIENAQAIKRIYDRNNEGHTLIFAINICHCEQISNEIPDSVVVNATTKDRPGIIQKFIDGEIKCIINCGVFFEGTDIPCVKRIIVCRPTKNNSLYTQMVGRGLRLFDGKDKLTLIDCCGVSNLNICTAPTLLGIDMLPSNKKPMTEDTKLSGDLFDLPEKVQKVEDTPKCWVINHKVVDLFAKKIGITTHDINFFKLPNGTLTLKFKSNKSGKSVDIKIPPPNSLGYTIWDGSEIKIQTLIDKIFIKLNNEFTDCKPLWDLKIVKSWGRMPPTDSQIKLIKRFFPNYPTWDLNKMSASFILTRIFNERKNKND